MVRTQDRMFRRRSQIQQHPTIEQATGEAPPGMPASRWLAARGAVRAELSADAIGSFPGFADYAGLIVDATVVLTDRYLLVDEGEPHGFGIAGTQLDWARADDAEVRVGYRQDGDRRSFLLRVRRSRRSPRPRAAATGLLSALRSANVGGEFPPPEASQNVALSWDDASAVEHERVRWTGRVTAPIMVGQECTPSDVWVSLESLLWASPRSKGVNRLDLSGIVSLTRAEIAGDEPTPALYLTIDDDAGGLIDLPFIFNLGESFERNNRDRSEFQNRIRGDRLPQVAPPARLQPWLSSDAGDGASEPDEFAEPDPDEVDIETTELRDVTDEGDHAPPKASPSIDAEDPATDDRQAFTNWPAHDALRGPLSSGARHSPGDRPGGINARRWRHARGVDGAVVPEVHVEEPSIPVRPVHEEHDIVLAEWAGAEAEPSKAYAAWPGIDVAIDEQPSEPPPPPAPTAVPAYERAALATIDAVLFVISRRVEGNSAPPLTTVPPSSVEQAAALSELVELTAAGVITPEEAREQKARLVAVGEASVRLRTLLELSGAGHLSLTELLKKRDSILRGIDYPVPGDG